MAHGRMRCENNAALQRIVCDGVVDEEIVVAFRCLIADENAIFVVLMMNMIWSDSFRLLHMSPFAK